MISFSLIDSIVLVLFFVVVLLVGFFSGREIKDDSESFLLSGRNVGLFLFILTNVSTWYGGILGVGEFTYRYGLLSWFTQGFPYYVFAIFFAIFFARKIRAASLFTIPDKLEVVYGKKTAMVSAVIIFILVSPAPYILMTANLLSLIFNLNFFVCLIISVILSIAYLFKGGYKSDVYTDAFEFFVMFLGFIVIVIIAYLHLGGIDYLSKNLPAGHLKFTGNASPLYIIVWFMIALWTFVDPGFHQRCNAARDSKTAYKGIIISIVFWALFDFLTTSTGLYARAYFPNLDRPVLAYPLLAEKLLGPGVKGFFYAAMFATILSTLNSFMFLSATTFSRDFVFRNSRHRDENRIKRYTIYGLILAGLISILLSYFFPSVIDIWYLIGSICIPGLILPVISAYYPKIRTGKSYALLEILLAFSGSLTWYFLRNHIHNALLKEIEPMIVGVIIASIVHFCGIIFRKENKLS